ncbi:Death-associated protein 1 [Taenia solium]|eukprot:TsM_000477600 transcript=TsM_000477600 gene=TsM_000477600
MGDRDDGADLAISNPPATKVGNMRVAQKHRDTGEKQLSRSEYMKQAQEYNSEIIVQPKHDFETRKELDFHDQSVVHSQQKPLPRVSKAPKPVQPIIYQPRSD